MEFFNHVQKVYTETNYDTLNLDIPLAIFMIKLLSIKVDFSHFRDENKFNEYMKSDRPLKLRYYLQVKFRDEMTKATEVAKQEWVKEKAYIEGCFKEEGINWTHKYLISFELRNELYAKYLKNKIFDDEIQDKISEWIESEWIEPYMVNGALNSEMRGLIYMEIKKKYGIDPARFKQNCLEFMHKFPDKESIDKLLHSMRDVYILGFVYEKDNDKKTLGWTIIKDADTYTHKFVEKNYKLEKCKSICQEKNYGGFTFCVRKDTMKPYGGGHMFNKAPNEGIENMMKTDTEAYFKLNPGVKQFNAKLYISPGASLELLKNKEKEGFDIKYDELDI